MVDEATEMLCLFLQSQNGKAAGSLQGRNRRKVQVMVWYVYANGMKHTVIWNCQGYEALYTSDEASKCED